MNILPEEKNFVKIKGAQVSNKLGSKEKKSQEEIKRERDKNDLEKFFKKYPDLKEVKIDNMKQFELNSKNRTKIMNPDMSCCNLTISLLMFMLSVFTF